MAQKNRFTIAREKIQKELDRQKLGPIKIEVMREPKEILLESANYFWARAQFLSNHARKLANEDASAASIDAVMQEADRQLIFACKCAEQAAPYYHPRVSGGLPDSDVVAYVARLPAPAETSEEWAATHQPPNAGWKRQQ